MDQDINDYSHNLNAIAATEWTVDRSTRVLLPTVAQIIEYSETCLVESQNKKLSFVFFLSQTQRQTDDSLHTEVSIATAVRLNLSPRSHGRACIRLHRFSALTLG